MTFVVLAEPDNDVHIYTTAPGVTLCGKPVRAAERGWFATGCPIDAPHFPLGPLCKVCRGLAAPS